jgi:hypothetical protein
MSAAAPDFQSSLRISVTFITHLHQFSVKKQRYTLLTFNVDESAS